MNSETFTDCPNQMMDAPSFQWERIIVIGPAALQLDTHSNKLRTQNISLTITQLVLKSEYKHGRRKYDNKPT